MSKDQLEGKIYSIEFEMKSYLGDRLMSTIKNKAGTQKSAEMLIATTGDYFLRCFCNNITIANLKSITIDSPYIKCMSYVCEEVICNGLYIANRIVEQRSLGDDSPRAFLFFKHKPNL